ncbi:MAG: hypothetical protein JNL58_02615 [Planctomyces sp.]|nr:hypothetical protein [Planctomyces sp.]
MLHLKAFLRCAWLGRAWLGRAKLRRKRSNDSQLKTCLFADSLETRCVLAASVLQAFHHEGHDYLVVLNSDSTTPTWQQVEQSAQLLGSHLATIDSPEENAFVTSAISDGAFWIGLNDIAMDGTFTWDSGADVSFMNWDLGQPADRPGNIDTVFMQGAASNGSLEPGKWYIETALHDGVLLPGLIEISTRDVFVQLPDGNSEGTAYELTGWYVGTDFQMLQLNQKFNDGPALSGASIYGATQGFLNSLSIAGTSGNDRIESFGIDWYRDAFQNPAMAGITFTGGEGDDYFRVGGGTDIFDGGPGIDTMQGWHSPELSFTFTDNNGVGEWHYSASDQYQVNVTLRDVEIYCNNEDTFGLIDPSMDEARLQEIISKLPDGGTLLFAPGDYRTAVHIEGKSLHLKAQPSWDPVSGFSGYHVNLLMDQVSDASQAAISWNRGTSTDDQFLRINGINIIDAAGDGIIVSGAAEVVLQDMTIRRAGRLGNATLPNYAGLRLTDVAQATVIGTDIVHTGLNIDNPFSAEAGSPIEGWDNHGAGLIASRTSSGPQQSKLILGSQFRANGFAAVVVENSPDGNGTVDVHTGWEYLENLWNRGTTSYEFTPVSSSFFGPGSTDPNIPQPRHGLGAAGLILNGPNIQLSDAMFGSQLAGGTFLRYPMIVNRPDPDLETFDAIAESYSLHARVDNVFVTGGVLYAEGADSAIGQLQSELWPENGPTDFSSDAVVTHLMTGNQFRVTGEMLLAKGESLTASYIETAFQTIAAMVNANSLALEEASNADAANFLDALSLVNPDSSGSDTIDVELSLQQDLNGEVYDGLMASVPENVILSIDLGTSTVGPGSPALTVNSGHVIVANGVLSQTSAGADSGTGDFPTILVRSGATLRLGDASLGGVRVEESDIFSQSAIFVESGALLIFDEHADNILDVRGAGQLIHYEAAERLDLSHLFTGSHLQFELDQTPVSDPFIIEDLIFHALDLPSELTGTIGLVSWQTGQIFITPATEGVQAGLQLATAGNTIHIADNFADGFQHNVFFTQYLAADLTIAGSLGSNHLVINLSAESVIPTGLRLLGDEQPSGTDIDVLQLKNSTQSPFSAFDQILTQYSASETGAVVFPNSDRIEFSDVELVDPGLDRIKLTGIDVERGLNQRSYVRYVDLIFDQPNGLLDMLNNNQLQLHRFDLNGNSVGMMSLPAHTINGSRIQLDFGLQGIGGSRNLNVGDGYYQIVYDHNQDGLFEADSPKMSFHRLLGDVNGDGRVDASDKSQVLLANRTSDPESDANGNGFVNLTDLSLVSRAFGRKLRDDLFTDD